MMASAMPAIQACLKDIEAGIDLIERMMPFDELRRIVGFDDSYQAAQPYAASTRNLAKQ